MAQKRIYELSTYTQLNPGDVGYIAATSIWLAVDYTGWTEAKKITLDDFLGSMHVEAGRLSGLGSRSVAVTFGTAFTGTVIDRVKVYRYFDPSPGETVREEVRFYDLSVTLTGFTLEIDPDEPLSGIIIDYNMLEA